MTELSQDERLQFIRLLDESAIRSVVASYANAVDWMNWPVVESLLWEDAKVDFGDFCRGDRAAFLPWVKALEESKVRRMHMFGEVRILIEGNSAQAEVASLTHVRGLTDAGRVDDLVYGRYLFKLEKRKGEWRLSAIDYLLNNFVSSSSTESDAGPMVTADNTCMTHPLAPRF